MNILFSYFVALLVSLLVLAPPINYDIPVIVNSFSWLYIVIASGLFGMYLFSTRLPLAFKILTPYLFVTCFFSAAPYLSFNAYILLVATMYFFILCMECDFKIITNMVEAVFWFEVVLTVLQLLDKDTLINFDRTDKVFFGTLMQTMRLSSVYALIAPFMILKKKWYVIPVMAVAILSKNVAFALAISAGGIVYVWHTTKSKWWIITPLLIFGIICAARSWQHIYVEIVEGRMPVWWVVIKTWALDTTKGISHGKDLFGISQTGPVDWKCLFFGHGMDTFLPLFPVYKHDPNPFPQVHNDWLQILWETGLPGIGCVLGYAGSLFYRTIKSKEYLCLSGLVVISIIMFFHFPMRMTQTMLLMVSFLALCEQRLSRRSGSIR